MNDCKFSGRVGRDCETRFTASGTPVSNFCIAVDTGWGDNKRTEWIDCVIWKREKLAQMLTKGKAVIVSGEYSTREWEDRDGNKRKSVEIVCRDVEFQNGNSDNGQSEGRQQGQTNSQGFRGDGSQYGQPAQQAGYGQQQQQQFQANNAPFTDMDDPPF